MADENEWVWETPPSVLDHTKRYLSDPEAVHMWNGGGGPPLPTLLLTTTGRRSGEPRHNPLIYRQVGDSYAVMASKAGFPRHPDWYLNLIASGEAEIRVGARRMAVRPRIAQGGERAELWAKLCEIHPDFADYQVRAKDREIPVVVLDPVG